MAETAEEYQKAAYITKKGYKEFSKAMRRRIKDTDLVDGIMKDFREIMKFDPEKKMITKEKLEKKQQQRDELKAQGITTWVSSGMNKVYERRRTAALEAAAEDD